MVDRIVPATKPEDIERLAALTGRLDLSPVMHEPFRQWVVEDRFVGGARPDLGAVGVQLVEDVTPFELMKLRMLNGTHSSLAYLGYLAGHETIADTVADPAFAGLRAAISGAPRSSRRWRRRRARISARYADALFERYANPAIRHRTWQIAMDGSQKLPQRILGTIADDARAPGGRARAWRSPSPAGCATSAASTRRARAIDVRDPLAAAAEGAERRPRRPGGPGRGAARGARDLPARRSPTMRGFREARRPPPTPACSRDGARAAAARVAG